MVDREDPFSTDLADMQQASTTTNISYVSVFGSVLSNFLVSPSVDAIDTMFEFDLADFGTSTDMQGEAVEGG